MGAELDVLNDVATNTTLNNLMELLEGRIEALDFEIKASLDKEILKNARSQALRICITDSTVAEVSRAINQLRTFYHKFQHILDDPMTKELEGRHITHLLNVLTHAEEIAINTSNKIADGTTQQALQNRGLIKTRFNIDGNSVNHIRDLLEKTKKERKKGGKTNGSP